MIEIDEAQKLMLSKVKETIAIELPVKDALGMVLSSDVYSPIDMPPFDQSAMDGYAICGDGRVFKITGEVAAGDTRKHAPLFHITKQFHRCNSCILQPLSLCCVAQLYSCSLYSS